MGYLLKGVIWIVASRSEPFSEIRPAHWGIPVEHLDSKKPPQRLALEDYVSLFFHNLPITAILSRFPKKFRASSFKIQYPEFYFETGFRLWVGSSREVVYEILIKGSIRK